MLIFSKYIKNKTIGDADILQSKTHTRPIICGPHSIHLMRS